MTPMLNEGFTPGRPIVIPTSAFGRDIQEAIIDNYFNGTESVYARTVDNMNNPNFKPNNGQPQQPGQDVSTAQPQPVAQPQNPNPGLSEAEIAELLNIKKAMHDDPAFLQAYARSKMDANRQPGGGTASGTQPASPQNEQDQDPWEALFNPSEPTPVSQNDLQPGQDQPHNPKPVGEEYGKQFAEGLIQECVKAGVKYEEVAEFVTTLEPSDYVVLFKEIKRLEQQTPAAGAVQPVVQTQQPQQPGPNLAEAPTPAVVRIQAPFSGGETKHPFWQ